MSILEKPSQGITQARDFVRTRLGVNEKKFEIQGPDFPGGFIIQELLEGNKPGEKLVLKGDLMPIAPFPWGGEQRLKKTFYNGNPEPSVQVLGAEETNITLRGRLKDRRFKDPELRGIAYDITKVLDAIRKRGNLVKFSLGDMWVRYGFVENAEFELRTLADISYSIDLSIVSDTLPRRLYFVEETKKVPLEISNQLKQALDEYRSVYDSIPDNMPRSLADQIRALISDIATAINSVTQYIDDTIATIDDISNALLRVQGLIQFNAARIRGYRQRLGGISLAVSVLGADVPSRYLNGVFVVGSASATHRFSDFLAQLQQRFAALSASTPQARHRVTDTDTLQTLAQRYYSDSKQWRRIYDHNTLTSTELVPGAILEIPK